MDITKLNGPVSMYIVILKGRTFNLIGDFHYDNEFRCDGSCDEITLDREYLDRGGHCINIDAAFFIWLTYNHQMNIDTDFFVETPLSTKGLIPPGGNVKNE